MAPLTVDDLIPFEDYASKRKEYFDSHRRYLERFRRVRIGPSVTLIFENRQTLWFRIQEVIRLARLARVEDLQQELNLYNRLLPDGQRLQAALLIDREELLDEAGGEWRDFGGENLQLRLGDRILPATLITNRPEDRRIGTALWVHFVIPASDRLLLSQCDQSARFRFEITGYSHESAELSEDFRLSLLDDLELEAGETKRTG